MSIKQINEETQISKRFAYIYKNGGNPIFESNQMVYDKSIRCKPIDKEWQELINKENWWASGYIGDEKGGDKEKELIKKLLTFGGYEVCMPYIEEDADKILSRGQLWYGDRVQVFKGRPSQCHSNICDLWEQNRNEHEVAIATGYALSSDGMWRQHSWMMLRGARSVKVIETTEKRVAYFGFVMTQKESFDFCDQNI